MWHVGRPLWKNTAMLGLAVCSSGFLFQTRRSVCVVGGGAGLSLGFMVGLLIMCTPGSRVGAIGGGRPAQSLEPLAPVLPNSSEPIG